jgi:hypothetical protein
MCQLLIKLTDLIQHDPKINESDMRKNLEKLRWRHFVKYF